jgi:hypothetical protein
LLFLKKQNNINLNSSCAELRNVHTAALLEAQYGVQPLIRQPTLEKNGVEIETIYATFVHPPPRFNRTKAPLTFDLI